MKKPLDRGLNHAAMTSRERISLLRDGTGTVPYNFTLHIPPKPESSPQLNHLSPKAVRHL